MANVSRRIVTICIAACIQLLVIEHHGSDAFSNSYHRFNKHRTNTFDSTTGRTAPAPYSSSQLSMIATSGFSGIKARRPSVESGLRYRSDDWLRNFLSIPSSFVLQRIQYHLTTNALLSILVIYLHRIFPQIAIPMTGHSILGSFLGLLLVFRTNSAYARFWEAIGAWAKCMTTCRNLSLLVMGHIRSHSPKSSEKIMDLLYAYPDALYYSCLCGSAPLGERVRKPLRKYGVLAKHVPGGGNDEQAKDNLEPATKLCYLLNRAAYEASVESSTSGTNILEAMHLAELTHGIDSLMDTLTTCRKIARTPVPLSYSRHTSRFLTLWCGTLPFALVGSLGYLTFPSVLSACWCLFGIEEIGHLIEQPFVGDSVMDGDFIDEELTMVVDNENDDEDDDIVEDSETLLTMSPLIRRAAKTNPFDIGLPVCKLARWVRKEIKGIKAYALLQDSYQEEQLHMTASSASASADVNVDVDAVQRRNYSPVGAS